MEWLDKTLIFSAVLALIILLCHGAELAWPARQQTLRAARLNLLYLVPFNFIHATVTPLFAALSVTAVNAMGGGFIVLPAAGWGLVAGIVAYTLAMDLSEYAFHRAQHRIPALWALHAFHHSDPALNVSTTFRHAWVEQSIKAVTIYALVGLLFKASPAVLSAYLVISYYNFFSHMNLRFGMGRWSWLINTPQYHRLHHSMRREDYDSRYASLFPIWDVIFGTYRKPAPGDFPETGLVDRVAPTNVWQAISWPHRSKRLEIGDHPDLPTRTGTTGT